MNLDQLATPQYRALLRERYTRRGWGASGKSHADTVAAYAERIGARTALDYGCGRGTLAPAVPQLHWQEYDPGFPTRDVLPVPADLVVCTDVLEHVERALLRNVMSHLRSLTLRGAFFVIALGPSKETLADGRNAHLIQANPTFWADHLMTAGFHVERFERVKGLWVWARPDV